MRTLAFDGRMGASGDMLLAALLAAGADRDALAPVENADSLDVAYSVGKTTKNGIVATTADVVLIGESDDQEGDHGQGDHSHGADGRDHEHDHSHAEGSGPTRTYAEVVDLVEALGLADDIERDALAIFERLGRAEAAVHGTDLGDTHFHEVGADDAIADIVGACLLVADLGVERVVTTPLATGGGEVTTGHGTYPVPTPAVVELAEAADWELRGGPVEAELLTPTGAAILAHLADGVDRLPSLAVTGSGYGAGGYSFPDRSNVLRALVGDARGALVREDVTVLETTLDDAAPEVLGGLQETLADAGALDVSVVPLTMKKSRPGHLVKVVVAPGDAGRVARRLAEETGTLGIRETGTSHRWVARRAVEAVRIEAGGESHDVAVKVATDDEGAVLDVSAEYDDALAVARGTDRPVREVLRLAEEAYRSRASEG
jgi:uncharacterized protein (TIGR00299 family) protein